MCACGACVSQAVVWGSEVHGAVDQGEAVAAWLNRFLGGTDLRLVYFHEVRACMCV